MTRDDHASGTDRLAELASIRGWSDQTIVVNLQGDEPLAPASGIRAVAATLGLSGSPMATLATPLQTAAELFDPNCVKVVCAGRSAMRSTSVARRCPGHAMPSPAIAPCCR